MLKIKLLILIVTLKNLGDICENSEECDISKGLSCVGEEGSKICLYTI